MAEPNRRGAEVLAEERFKPPAMPWYEQDFWSRNTRNMKPLARLMYRSLLQQAWHSDNPPYLPADDQVLMEMADAPTSKMWATHRDSVLARFMKTEDGKWLFHPKSLRQYQEALAKHQHNVNAGRAGGRAKAATQPGCSDAKHGSSYQNHSRSQNHTDGWDSEEAVQAIIEAHPKSEYGQAVEAAVIDAICDEAKKRGISEPDAAVLVLKQTLTYAYEVSQWPDKTVAHGCENFFRKKIYRQDPAMWRKPSGNQQQGGEQRAYNDLPVNVTMKRQNGRTVNGD
jgi:hypothetical protein